MSFLYDLLMSFLNKSLRITVVAIAVCASFTASAAMAHIDLDSGLSGNFRSVATCDLECQSDVLEAANAFLDALENGRRPRGQQVSEKKETGDDEDNALSPSLSIVAMKIHTPSAIIEEKTEDHTSTPHTTNTHDAKHYSIT